MIINGDKHSTIRLPRTRVVAVGDIMDLRTWSGVPYRSKQTKLREVVCTEIHEITIREVVCTEIHEITIREIYVFVSGRTLSYDEVAQLATSEGFRGIADMMLWFFANHSLPMTGTLYRWKS